jgi:prolyl oligopeptidase
MKSPSIRPFLSVAWLTLLLSVVTAQGQSAAMPPATPKRSVTNVYYGVKIADDYRWLEDWNDPHVKQWSNAENAYARAYLDHIPSRPAVKERLQQLTGESIDYFDLQYKNGVLFALKFAPPKQQPFLIILKSAMDPSGESVVVDPNTLSDKASMAIDFYSPSLDGRLVAVALSENGSEDSTGRVFEVATGKELGDRVPRVNFATGGGSITWNADSSGFYYARYPQGNERPPEDANFYQQVYFHKLGTDSSQDVYGIGKEFPRIAEIELQTSDDGRWVLAAVKNGDGGEVAHYIMDGSSSKWTQVTRFEDKIISVKLGPDGALYLLSHQDSPRGKVLRVPLSDPQLARAEVIVPQSSGKGTDESGRASIEEILPTPARLYVIDVVGGPSRVRIFDHQWHQIETLPLSAISAVDEIKRVAGDDVLYDRSSYVEPSAWYYFDSTNGKAARTGLFQTSPVKLDDAEVVREFAVSKDGTRVPLNIIRRKGTKLDGMNPTILYGYGGYGVNLSPAFLNAFGRVWLDEGGVYAIANLRGGGEYGEEWHLAGNLTQKQNVFDDFIACAQYLINRNYTSTARFAIRGGSNGGLLMGAALTQRPELFRAVVSYVGIYDMLRVELDPNGAFNTTEFGTVKDPEQFKALYTYSPYHHVKDGTAYPAVLFLTGENDHRVNPMNSRKMTARLQAATSSNRPILLRTTASAGHGIGTALNERIEQSADALSFLFDQLGVKYAPVNK